MGGSLAFLVKKYFPDAMIYAADADQKTIDFALSQGIIQSGSTEWTNFPKNLDLIWICTPISTIEDIAFEASEYFDKATIITDIGSVKQPILNIFRNTHSGFIAGHPMAGIEKTGIEYASVSIVEKAPYILITQISEKYAVFSKFIAQLGFDVIEMEAEAHDEAMAYASHLPYLMACLTASASAHLSEDKKEQEDKEEQLQRVLGPGFRDTTRVAASSVHWGTDVCRFNKKAILEALSEVEKQIKDLKEKIITGNPIDIQKKLQGFKDARTRLIP